jgi:hypothetical protein
MQTQACPAATFGEAIIASPRNPLKPTPSLSTSATIGECADLVLDPSGSSGAGGRAWKTINWVVTGDGSQNATAISLINSMLNSDYANTKKRATVPKKWIDSGGSYTIKLQLTNFLNQYSQSSTSVTVTSVAKQPVVSIAGPKQVSKYRANAITLKAIGSVPLCGGVAAAAGAYTIEYTWKVYVGSIFQSTIKSVSKDPRYFKLRAYTLDANTVYTVYVTASLEGNTATSSVTLSLGSAGVVASILGGAKRSGSTKSEVVFESGSYSIDYPTDDNALTYTWTCSEVSPNFGDDCPASLAGPTTAEATIAANAFTRAITASYTVSLFVSNTDGTASASASTEIEMVSSEIPEITIGATETKYNPAQKIILTSTVSAIGSAWVTWSSSEFNSTEWASRALTSLQYQVPTGDTVAELAISANSLVGGVTYTFILSATYSTDPNQIDKYEEISILMNEAPYGGIVTSVPVNGTSLDTEFLFETADWNDDPDDIPLEYIISTYAESSSKTIVSTIGTTTYVETTCGQGLEDNDYQVYVEVEAYDVYGAMASTLTNITVSPLDNSLLAATADTALETAFANSDPVAVSSVINAVSAALNVVNCTVPTPCASLNRDVCVKTPKTCGECLSGYLGVDGDANKMCSDPTALRKIGAACTTDANCITDYCHPTDLVCSELDKTCKDDCSGNGDCVFVSVTTGNTLSSCAQSDTTCYAECQNCVSGYFGATCGLTQANFDSNVALRETLCKSIYDTVDIQDITEDVMKSRSTTLSGLLLDPTQLSTYSIANCTAALVRTVELAPEYAGLDTVSDLVAETLSGVLGLSLNTELLANVSETLKSLTSSVQDNLAVGEAQKAFNTDNARIGAEVVDPNSVSGARFGPPQTDTEVFNTVPITTFGVTAGSALGALGVSVVQYKNNPTGSVTDNTPIGMQTTNYATATRRRRRLQQHLPDSLLLGSASSGDDDTAAFATTMEGSSGIGRRGRRRLQSSSSNTVTLELKNNGDVDYFDIPATNSWIVCPQMPLDYEKYVDCLAVNASTQELYNLTYSFTCPALQTSNFSYTCPAVSRLPKCQTFDGTDFSEDSSCTLLNYTASETFCECDVDSSRRRLSISSASQSELKQFSSTAEVMSDSFTQTISVIGTFEGDDDKASPAEKFAAVVDGNTVIFYFMLSILIVSILGVVLTAFKDHGDISHWKSHVLRTQEIRDKVKAMRTIDEFINDALPLEFTGVSWHKRFKQRLIENHDWISCVLPYKESGAESWASFTNGMAKIVNFLFVDTILAGLFFADDGTCETYTNEEDCTFQRALSQVDSLCEWDFDSESFYNATVYYNVTAEHPVFNGTDLYQYYSSCTFGGESSNFMSTLILVLVIAVVTVPFNQMSEYLVKETVALFSIDKAIEKKMEAAEATRRVDNRGGDFDDISKGEGSPWRHRGSVTTSSVVISGVPATHNDGDKGSSPWRHRGSVTSSVVMAAGGGNGDDDGSSPWRHRGSVVAVIKESGHEDDACSDPEPYSSDEDEDNPAWRVSNNEKRISVSSLRDDDDPSVEEEEEGRGISFADSTHSSRHQLYARVIDNLQTRAGTILRGARLVKMQQTIDDVDSDEECESLLRHHNSTITAAGHHEDHESVHRGDPAITVPKPPATAAPGIMGGVARWYIEKNDYGFGDMSQYVEAEREGKCTGVVKVAVQKARSRADDIVEDLESMEDETEQDMYLLRRFVVDSLSSYERNVAMRFVDVQMHGGTTMGPSKRLSDSNHHDNSDACKVPWRVLCFIGVLLNFTLFCFYIFLFGVRLGPAGVSIWLTGAGLVFMQATLILQPLKIFVYFVAVSGISTEKVRLVHGIIRERLKGVLQRNTNVMTGFDSLVQHLNPACRAARKFPHLRMSRVLMSLNDHDVPIVHYSRSEEEAREQRYSLVMRTVSRTIGLIILGALVVIVLLPGVFGDAFMETGVTVLFNLSIAALHSMSLIGTIALPVCLVLVIIGVGVYLDRHHHTRLTEMRWSLKMPIPLMDIEDKVQKRMIALKSVGEMNDEISAAEPDKNWRMHIGKHSSWTNRTSVLDTDKDSRHHRHQAKASGHHAAESDDESSVTHSDAHAHWKDIDDHAASQKVHIVKQKEQKQEARGLARFQVGIHHTDDSDDDSGAHAHWEDVDDHAASQRVVVTLKEKKKGEEEKKADDNAASQKITVTIKPPNKQQQQQRHGGPAHAHGATRHSDSDSNVSTDSGARAHWTEIDDHAASQKHVHAQRAHHGHHHGHHDHDSERYEDSGSDSHSDSTVTHEHAAAKRREKKGKNSDHHTDLFDDDSDEGSNSHHEHSTVY